MSDETRIRSSGSVEPALSIGHCAKLCTKNGCTLAKYDQKSNLVSYDIINGVLVKQKIVEKTRKKKKLAASWKNSECRQNLLKTSII